MQRLVPRIALNLRSVRRAVVSVAHLGCGLLTLSCGAAHSDEARRAHLLGTAVLSLVVDKDGQPEIIKVVQGLGLGLDEKAIEAVEHWRFKPGLKDGKPVSVGVMVEVSFQLIGKRCAPGGYQAARVGGGGHPCGELCQSEIARGGSVMLALDVDAKGRAQHVRAVRSSNTGLEHAGVESVRKWRFYPATKGGPPVASSGSAELSFAP